MDSAAVDLEAAERQEVGKMEAKLKCPRCKVYMQKLKKKDVIIDVCGKCGGMWLDAGEMEKLAEMARGEQIDKK